MNAPRPMTRNVPAGWDEAVSHFIDTGRQAVARAEKLIGKSLDNDREIATRPPQMVGGWR